MKLRAFIFAFLILGWTQISLADPENFEVSRNQLGNLTVYATCGRNSNFDIYSTLLSVQVGATVVYATNVSPSDCDKKARELTAKIMSLSGDKKVTSVLLDPKASIEKFDILSGNSSGGKAEKTVFKCNFAPTPLEKSYDIQPKGCGQSVHIERVNCEDGSGKISVVVGCTGAAAKDATACYLEKHSSNPKVAAQDDTSAGGDQ